VLDIVLEYKFNILKFPRHLNKVVPPMYNKAGVHLNRSIPIANLTWYVENSAVLFKEPELLKHLLGIVLRCMILVVYI
jgi:hypothetical protein